MNTTEWTHRIEASREQKDEFFALYPKSPIPAQNRADFEGLDYFSPVPDYYFELETHQHENKETITVEDTSGHTQQMVRWGSSALR